MSAERSFRALMVDVDGVLVVRPVGRRWDAALADDLGVRPRDLQRVFFDRHWDDVVTGKARIENRLPDALEEIAPDVDAEDLLDYWFAEDSELDEVLLSDLDALRASGTAVHLATVQEHRRAEYLWSTLGLEDHFDGMHHSAAVGFAKPDRAYFAAVASRVELDPGELLLLDDSRSNVDGALAAGWQARLWTGRQRLLDVLA